MDIIIMLLLNAIAYLTIPVIVILIFKKRKLSKRAIKWIAFINAFILYAIFSTIGLTMVENYKVNPFPSFLWGEISYFLMKKNILNKNLIDDEPVQVATNIPISPQVEIIVDAKKLIQNKPLYCKHCSGLIEKTTNKCTKCGKQNFIVNIINLVKKHKIISILSIICILLSTCTIAQYSQIQKDKAKLIELAHQQIS